MMKGTAEHRMLRRRKTNERVGNLIFLLPATVLFIIFFILPLCMSFQYSLTNESTMRSSSEFVGFTNYSKVFEDMMFRSSIQNTLIFAIGTTLLINFFAILIAVALGKSNKLNNLFRMLIFIPAVLSPLIVGYLWSYILSPMDSGLLNMMLKNLGLETSYWLGDSKLALPCIMAIHTWQWTGYCAVIYIANIQTIPEEFYEAAKVDGATGLQTFFHITLPSMLPSIKVNMIIFMISGLKVYDIVVSTTGGGPGYATTTITKAILDRGISMGQYGYASALAIVLFVIIFAITMVQLKLIGKWDKIND